MPRKKKESKGKSSGQAAIETLAVAGFAIIIFTAAVMIFYYYSSSGEDTLTQGQAEKVVNTLTSKADELAVYDVGFATQIQLDIPEGLEEDLVFGGRDPITRDPITTKEIAIRIKTANDAVSTIAGRAAFAEIEGRIFKTPGLKTINICSREGKVCIVELQPGQSCLNPDEEIKRLCPGLIVESPEQSETCYNGRLDANEACDGSLFKETASACSADQVRTCNSCNVECRIPEDPAPPAQPTQPESINSSTFIFEYALEGKQDEAYPSAIIRQVDGIPDDYYGVNDENTAFYDADYYKANAIYEKLQGTLYKESWQCNSLGSPCIDQGNTDEYKMAGIFSGGLSLVDNKFYYSSIQNPSIAKIEYGIHDYKTLKDDNYNDNADVRNFNSIRNFTVILKDETRYYYTYPVFAVNKNGKNVALRDRSIIAISDGNHHYIEGEYASFSYTHVTEQPDSVDNFDMKFLIDKYAYAWLLTKVEKPGTQTKTFSYVKRFSKFIAPYDARLMSITGDNYAVSPASWPSAVNTEAKPCRDALQTNKNILVNCKDTGFTHGYMEIAQQV